MAYWIMRSGYWYWYGYGLDMVTGYWILDTTARA